MSKDNGDLDNWDNIKPRFEDKNGNPVMIDTQLKDLKLADREALGIKTDAIVIEDSLTGGYIEIESEDPVEITDNLSGEAFQI